MEPRFIIARMKTAVAIRDLIDALDSASDEASSFVHRRTGEMRTLTHEALRLVEEGGDPEMPDWQQDEVEFASEVLESDDWLALSSQFDIHEWAIMDRFGQTLPREQQDEVRDALRGRGAFRMFKATIRRLGIEDAWFEYKRRALEDIARRWLEEHGLQAADSATAGR